MKGEGARGKSKSRDGTIHIARYTTGKVFGKGTIVATSDTRVTSERF
jgi:hypothetical protein